MAAWQNSAPHMTGPHVLQYLTVTEIYGILYQWQRQAARESMEPKEKAHSKSLKAMKGVER
ncbi:MAG: hypothetical protein Q4A65_07080 [Bacillota bacterium]|nr:hypothetical protein [Bacillota bacterium]